ncbi:uracil-DNA glycosylase [Acidovorax sp. Leaf76]|uniref:uracil-DNA glycosylase n=1 Tax=unclassified Acidovorax TaxID=2684926 RepID=UPI0006F24E2C|nr:MULTISPECIES: uracil-DNA glycosylase [unclassified Acidovorax]KQO14012.1 uracil-DNA glycosylase [Acidovorax sp. Leaf76]KQO31532.1 uracil-DNA glycosylase [Acidovorax sp. Leaf84]KQS27552.1 uracil-DNA glycosylase [Acidovorax sp. Leaf191]
MNDAAANPTQLQTADPADWPVAPGWQPLVDDFFAGARGQSLLAFLQSRLDAGAVIFPPRPLRALELTPPDEVRVVILGQDPYHGRGQAEGLAFSVAPGVRLPPSLQNIFKEMQRDLGVAFPPFPQPGGSLVKWAKNGVLLLNTGLTVEEGQPASHAGKGWEALTDAVIRHVAEGERPVVFMLWGSHAQSKRALIPQDRGHLLLMSNHPSPLSALRPPVPFIGNGHFGQARDFRAQHGY